MIKKKLFFAITIAIGGLLMSACSKSDPDKIDILPNEDNSAILELMKTNYAWNLPNETPDLMTDTKIFFQKLLNSKDTLSTIIPVADLNTSSSPIYDIGFEYAANQYSDGKTYYIVLYVKKGSKAEELIKRGYIITHVSPTGLEIDQIPVTGDKNDKGYLETLLPNCIKSGNQFSIRYRIPGGGEAVSTFNSANITVKRPNDQDPLYYSNSNIAPSSGRKIGYIVLNHFSYAEEFLQPLISKLNDFKNESVKTLILDLRYNSSGDFKYLSELGSALVKKSEQGAAFAYLARENSSNDRPYEFSNNQVGPNLADQLDNIYVITGKNTAGPSETLIHALRAYWGDKLIVTGENSQGMNIAVSGLANVKLPDGRVNWVINIPLGHFADKNKNYDYRTKVNNDYKEVNEESGTKTQLKSLGDPQEYVLSETLNLMGVNVAPVKNRSSKTSNQPVPVKYLGSSIKSEPGTVSLENLRY